MSEEVARAVGAGSSAVLVIDGKEYAARPLGLRQLKEIERACLRRYKQSVLETYADGADLLPPGTLEAKFEEVSKWDSDDLPPRTGHNPDRIKLTEYLRAWLIDKFEPALDKRDDRTMRRLAVAALDATKMPDLLLTAEQYTDLTGEVPPVQRVPYVSWWLTGTLEGLTEMIWTCYNRDGLTREAVERAVGERMADFAAHADEISSLSAARADFGPDSAAAESRETTEDSRKAG